MATSSYSALTPRLQTGSCPQLSSLCGLKIEREAAEEELMKGQDWQLRLIQGRQKEEGTPMLGRKTLNLSCYS